MSFVSFSLMKKLFVTKLKFTICLFNRLLKFFFIDWSLPFTVILERVYCIDVVSISACKVIELLSFIIYVLFSRLEVLNVKSIFCEPFIDKASTL